MNHDLGIDTLIVAEIGVNHEGSEAKARSLISLASQCGAGAVKLQSYTPGLLASTSDPDRRARVERFALDESAQRRIFAHAASIGLHAFSTAVTEDWIHFLADRPAIKIASGDITFEPLVRSAFRTQTPVILSTGLATVEEIDQAVSWARDEIRGADLSERLVLMQCVSAYPTPVEEANVATIPFLRKRYSVPVGYSNHVVGIEPCLAAVALGASILEVHFTDQREGRAFRDHALSCDPPMLAELVERVPKVRASLGTGIKQRQPSELPNLQIIRKGIIASRDLPAGHMLTEQDLAFARPATEFPANEARNLVGQRLTVPVATGELIRRDAVDTE